VALPPLPHNEAQAHGSPLHAHTPLQYSIVSVYGVLRSQKSAHTAHAHAVFRLKTGFSPRGGGRGGGGGGRGGGRGYGDFGPPDTVTGALIARLGAAMCTLLAQSAARPIFFRLCSSPQPHTPAPSPSHALISPLTPICRAWCVRPPVRGRADTFVDQRHDPVSTRRSRHLSLLPSTCTRPATLSMSVTPTFTCLTHESKTRARTPAAHRTHAVAHPLPSQLLQRAGVPREQDAGWED
jgi:hypothetical protein